MKRERDRERKGERERERHRERQAGRERDSVERGSRQPAVITVRKEGPWGESFCRGKLVNSHSEDLINKIKILRVSWTVNQAVILYKYKSLGFVY